MKIVIATPLYPPDIEETAAYVKELARRLSLEHFVTIVAYGAIPEEVPSVRIVVVSKRLPILLRLIAYTFALMREARRANLIYAQNGASVELPSAIATLITRTPLIMHTADPRAYQAAHQNLLRFLVQRSVYWLARVVVTDMPLPKPEILPFGPPANTAAFEESWKQHSQLLAASFTHGT